MTANHTPASPLLDEHRSLGARLTDFAGWAMPLKYGSELAEHRAVREAGGLFDLSHMGEIAVTGPQSAEALDFALAGEASKIPVGRAKYSLMCDADGRVIDWPLGWPARVWSWLHEKQNGLQPLSVKLGTRSSSANRALSSCFAECAV